MATGKTVDAMARASGFCDLNLPYDAEEDGGIVHDSIRSRISRAVSLGYDAVAVNVSVHQDDLLLTKAAKKGAAKKAKLSSEDKKAAADFPEPPKIVLGEEDLVDRRPGSPRPTVLTRLTITFRDNNFLPTYNKSQAAKKYDLVAVCPTSTVALQNLLKSSFLADIVTFDPENAADVRWSRKLYMECVDKHMYFELPYAQCIRDATLRRRTITQSHNYFSAGKSRNVIVTSGAFKELELRGPYDAANLGFIFGLNEHQSKLAVSGMPLEAVKAAGGRKVGPYRATVQKIEDLEECDRWKVPSEIETVAVQ